MTLYRDLPIEDKISLRTIIAKEIGHIALIHPRKLLEGVLRTLRCLDVVCTTEDLYYFLRDYGINKPELAEFARTQGGEHLLPGTW